MFKFGRIYTREQIHSAVEGGIRDYLPPKRGHVVCGCFRTDTNPQAPDVILPGDGPDIRRWAKVFREQKYAIPIFIKKRTNAWEYIGDYQVERWTEDVNDIAKFASLAGRTDVTSVLFLKRQ